ncbi:hypothetical protein SAMN05444392_106119 [Seinonella peptonophila]|uniref:Uncharacterized protein n=1 Tax=Seinonella peptonophila TaxID=112248 RepID=A0A1M4Y970_9BACL|nr:hypothetical protein [Seinonella peptonophila]SHF02377.1 hypothetical protein SAMN05444392_106119 [Seinonella peptonophila]
MYQSEIDQVGANVIVETLFNQMKELDFREPIELDMSSILTEIRQHFNVFIDRDTQDNIMKDLQDHQVITYVAGRRFGLGPNFNQSTSTMKLSDEQLANVIQQQNHWKTTRPLTESEQSVLSQLLSFFKNGENPQHEQIPKPLQFEDLPTQTLVETRALDDLLERGFIQSFHTNGRLTQSIYVLGDMSLSVGDQRLSPQEQQSLSERQQSWIQSIEQVNELPTDERELLARIIERITESKPFPLPVSRKQLRDDLEINYNSRILNKLLSNGFIIQLEPNIYGIGEKLSHLPQLLHDQKQWEGKILSISNNEVQIVEAILSQMTRQDFQPVDLKSIKDHLIDRMGKTEFHASINKLVKEQIITRVERENIGLGEKFNQCPGDFTSYVSNEEQLTDIISKQKEWEIQRKHETRQLKLQSISEDLRDDPQLFEDLLALIPREKLEQHLQERSTKTAPDHFQDKLRRTAQLDLPTQRSFNFIDQSRERS